MIYGAFFVGLASGLVAWGIIEDKLPITFTGFACQAIGLLLMRFKEDRK